MQVDAGIAEDLVFGDPKAPRFVFWNKKLRPTPSGPDVLTFDLLSIWGKIRAGLGAAGVKKPLPGQSPPLQLYAFSQGSPVLCCLHRAGPSTCLTRMADVFWKYACVSTPAWMGCTGLAIALDPLWTVQLRPGLGSYGLDISSVQKGKPSRDDMF